MPKTYGQEGQTPLRQLAAAKNLYFGTAIDWPVIDVLNDPGRSELYGREASVFTAPLIWSVVEYTKGKRDFSLADGVIAFAETWNGKVAGQPLIYPLFNPDWVVEALSSAPNKEIVIQRHIRQLIRNFRSVPMHYWVVLNEAIRDDQTTKNFIKSNLFVDAFGKDYADRCFRLARENDVATPLIYNDYMLEFNSKKQGAVLRFLEGMKARAVPIDGLGLQGHLTADAPINQKKLANFLKEVSDMGLRLYVTELDVVDQALPTDTKKRDAKAASIVKGFLDVVLDNTACDTVMAWGLIDGISWLNRGKVEDNGDWVAPRKDKTPHRPCPFDDDLKPKPMRDAIAAAIAAAEPRPAPVASAETIPTASTSRTTG